MTLSDEVLAARQIRAEKGLTGGSQQPRRAGPGDPDDVAPMVVYLASEAAANINGQGFGAAGGNYSLYQNPIPIKSIHKDGRWTLDELDSILPTSLLAGLVNPSPPQPPKE